MKSLSKAREHTTKRLAGIAVPDCFADATVSAAVNAYSRETKSARTSRRRLVSKVDRLNAEPRYRFEDDPAEDAFGADTSFTLASFAESNAEDLNLPNYLRELSSLSVGGSMWLGGGAAPVVTIRRVS